jgi:urease accessory protein
MLTVSRTLARGGALAPVLIARAPTVELAWDVRQRSRFHATDSSGRRLGVFLPRGTVVRGGDVLVAEDGSLVSVRAAREPVLRVRPHPVRGSPFDLLRAAYHLGNRHVQLELAPDHLKLEPDHVLADMLRGMGLAVDETEEPFEPEAGAYSSHGQAHGHGHGHAHGHGHGHGHGHRHVDAHGHRDAAHPRTGSASRSAPDPAPGSATARGKASGGGVHTPREPAARLPALREHDDWQRHHHDHPGSPIVMLHFDDTSDDASVVVAAMWAIEGTPVAAWSDLGLQHVRQPAGRWHPACRTVQPAAPPPRRA